MMTPYDQFVYTLGDGIRDKAEWFFGERLGDVRLTVDSLPGRVGVVALARGRTIHLGPRVLCLPRLAFEEVIGHELAHVVRTRQSSRASAGDEQGLHVVDDPAQEREAVALGREFALSAGQGSVSKGDAALRPVAVEPGWCERARGMRTMVAIGGEPLAQLTTLSNKAKQVLAMIDDGERWLRWSMASSSSRFDFRDESAMLSGIQVGLHGSPLLNARRLELRVAPDRLMELPPDAVAALSMYERGDPTLTVEQRVKKILKEQRLCTAKELALGPKFLEELGVADAPVFHPMTLEQQIMILELMESMRPGSTTASSLGKEAASYAAEAAVNAYEFVDLYQSYVALAAKRGLLGGSSEQRLDALNALGSTLQSPLYGLLDGLSVGGVTEPERVVHQLRTFIAGGGQLGFARMTAGLRVVIQHMDPNDDQGGDKLLADCVERIDSVLAKGSLVGVNNGQDGLTAVYSMQSEDGRVDLSLDALGSLTVATLAEPSAGGEQSASKTTSSESDSSGASAASGSGGALPVSGSSGASPAATGTHAGT
ncbi:MAG: DUF4157 domain-containing protein [Myxococcota bacterium]